MEGGGEGTESCGTPLAGCWIIHTQVGGVEGGGQGGWGPAETCRIVQSCVGKRAFRASRRHTGGPARGIMHGRPEQGPLYLPPSPTSPNEALLPTGSPPRLPCLPVTGYKANEVPLPTVPLLLPSSPTRSCPLPPLPFLPLPPSSLLIRLHGKRGSTADGACHRLGLQLRSCRRRQDGLYRCLQGGHRQHEAGCPLCAPR